MSNIELRKRFFGEGIAGTVDISSGPTLSWSEPNALLANSASLQLIRKTLEGLGLDICSVAFAVDELEARLGLKLDQQSMILDQQMRRSDGAPVGTKRGRSTRSWAQRWYSS